MRAHYLQHVAFEGLGSIEPWLSKAGFEISHSELFIHTDFPKVEEIDFLVVMGGPMSANDEQEFPWLAEEKAFIKQAIALGIPTLGICLGAQLIANTLGANVYANPVKEIGWFPIQAVPTENSADFKFPESLNVFHWHGETFSLPAGARRIAKSMGCDNQAFQLADHVIGLQFHLETTAKSAEDIVHHCQDELVVGEYIQPEAGILLAPEENYQAINGLMEEILEYLLERVSLKTS